LCGAAAFRRATASGYAGARRHPETQGAAVAIDYREARAPRILAHRGLALEHPENTLAAFAAALAAGADTIETDARATRDGFAVLCHDPDLASFDGSGARVAELPLAGLRAHLRDGSGVPRLAEALDAFPEACFNIDVKSADAVAAVAHDVRAANAERRVLVTSFSGARLRAVARLLPEAARGASSTDVAFALLAMETRSERGLARALRGAHAVQIPERQAGLTLVSPRRLAAFERHVREVHVWTIDDPAEMRRLVAAGVDGIVTDRADLAVAAFR